MSSIKHLIIFYIDVGQLPPEKALAFVEKCKDTALVDKLRKQGHECMWLPIRPGSSTRVEVLPLSEESSSPDQLATDVYNAQTIKSSNLMSDEDILTKWLGYSAEEAKVMCEKVKLQKLEELKLQVLADNPASVTDHGFAD